jgi:hypothetical protein
MASSFFDGTGSSDANEARRPEAPPLSCYIVLRLGPLEERETR